MKKPLIISFLSLCIFSLSTAQETTFPRDTSYTLRSAYQKYVKDYPEIKLATAAMSDYVREQNNMVYKNTGSRNLHLDIYSVYPGAEKRTPVVVLIHGGGWISGDKSMLRSMAVHLANNGFGAVLVEYRLSPEARYPAAVHDIRDAIQWIRSSAFQYNFDPDKIAVLGTSAGGQLAALTGTLEGSDAIKAIIDLDGVLAFIHPVSEEGRVAGLWLGGNQTEKRDVWVEASALTHADSTTPPTLFIGSKYPRFLAGHEEMMLILESNDIYSEFHRFDDAPHSFWLFDPWFQPAMGYILEFLNKMLTR